MTGQGKNKSRRRWRGVVHAHSAYSHDGAQDLGAWIGMLEQERLDFAMLTEHVEDMTPGKFARYVAECRDRSTPDRLLIPGIEYTFEDGAYHLEVLLIGEDAYVECARQDDVWAHRESKGLLALLPHPAKFGPLPRSVVDRFDLIEVWNLRYDGGYFLPWRNIALFKAHKREREVYAICGPDYHQPGDRMDLVTVVEAGRVLDGGALVAALKRGRFHCEYPGVYLPADLDMSLATVAAKAVWRLARRGAYLLGRSLVRRAVVRRLVHGGLRDRLRALVR